MKIKRIFTSLAIVLLGFSAPRVIAEEVHTPPAGSSERKAIMDGMRAWVLEQHGIKAIFVVNALLVKDGYAWIDVNPQSPDGSNRYEPLQGVMQRNGNGDWQMVFPDVALEFIVGDNLSEAAAREKANALLLEQVPGIPRELVPR